MAQAIHTEAQVEVDSHGALANDGITASLGLNGQLFLFQLLNFTVVAIIVWFLILKPLSKKLEERKNLIDSSLEKAKEVETNLLMSEQKYQDKIDEAKVEANKIMAKAQAEGKELTEDMKNKAKNDIEGLVIQAKHNIKTEKDNMVIELKAETGNLVVAAVEKILKEKLDEKKDKGLIEESLKDLKK